MTNSTPHGDPYWAPTNFSDWNMYRIGGFVSFMLWFIAIILWAAIGWVALSKAKRKLILAEEEKVRLEAESFVLVVQYFFCHI